MHCPTVNFQINHIFQQLACWQFLSTGSETEGSSFQL